MHDAFVAVGERWATVANPGGYLRATVVNGCRRSLRRRERGMSPRTQRRGDNRSANRARRAACRARAAVGAAARSHRAALFRGSSRRRDRRVARLPRRHRPVDRASIASRPAQGAVMTSDLEDRLRADLPRLADLIEHGADDGLPVLVPARATTSQGSRRSRAALAACVAVGGVVTFAAVGREKHTNGSSGRVVVTGVWRGSRRRQSDLAVTPSRCGPVARSSCGAATGATRAHHSRCRPARPTTRRRTRGGRSRPTDGPIPAR